MSKIVYVEWVDSSSAPGNDVWTSAEAWKGHELKVCCSIGRVIEETKHHIILAGHWCDDTATTAVHGSMCIPKCAIRRTKVIRK